MKSVKDLIYFDTEKARSILSQLNQGLISEISRAFEDETELSTGIGFDIKVIKGNIGGKGKEKVVQTEKITLYHEMLNALEKELINSNILTDINEAFQKGGKSFNNYMKEIPNMSFIKANGWSVFEDFERFKRIFSNFNDVQRLIFQSQLDANPELKQLREQLSEAKKTANKNKNRNAKSKDLQKIKIIEKKLDDILKSQTDINLFDEEFVRRVQVFLDTFSPKRLNFRLVPLDSFSDFQILSNLKSQYIIDGDFENIIYTYGSKPNIRLSVIGIITSVPQQIDVRVNPNDEFLEYDDNELADVQVFDKAFRNVFDSFEEFEKFFLPSYPKISVSPIAIYREVIIKENK